MSRLARVFAAGCALWLACNSWALAAEKAISVRGNRVVLKESPDLILVRSKGAKAAVDLASQAVEAQAKALDRQSPAPLALLAKRPAMYVKVLGGMLVPKLEGVSEEHHDDIAAASEAIESVHTVYRVDQQHVVPLDTITVRYKGGHNPRFLFAVASEFDLDEVSRPKTAPGLVRYSVPLDVDPFALCEKLAAKGFIQWAEPDLAMQINFAADVDLDKVSIPNDPRFAGQWHMQPGEGGVQVPESWLLSRGTSDITVAIIDTGIDMLHRDLKANLVEGFDFIDRDDVPQPDTGDPVISPHGTVCAGMVAAITGNGRGIAGPAPNAKLMPIRVAGTGGFATDPDLAEAIVWSAEHGAKILSCSWGGPTPSNQIADAIDEVTADGCLVFFAAGNDGPDGDVCFPAQFDAAIAVGATTRNRKLAEFSSFTPGKLVDLSAPGMDILSCDMLGKEGYADGGPDAQPDENGEHPGDYVAGANGTSFACPMAAGVAALVWSTFPSLTNAQVREILQQTATKIDPDGGQWQNGYSDRYGYGQVNALAALRRAQEVAGDNGKVKPPPSNKPDDKVRPDGQPANAQEILDAIMQLRGDAGAPKLTKDLPNPKTIALRRDQLAEVLKPQSQSYFVRGHEVLLKPSEKWFVMSLDDKGEWKGPQFWQVVRKDATEEELDKISVAAQGAGRIALVAPREVLRERKELDDFAGAATLPPIYPAYEHGGSLLVPLGTLTLRMKKDAGDDAKQAVLAEAQALGLRVVKEDGDITRFGQTDVSEHASLFAAVAQLAQLNSVQWCEPDLASRPLVLPKKPALNR